MKAGEGPVGRGERWFVGRKDIRDAVRAFLDEPGRGYRLRAGGTWGIGKTELVEKLHDEAKELALVLHINAGAYVPYDDETGGANPHALDVVRNWNSFVCLIADLVDCAPRTEEWNALSTEVQKAATTVASVRAGDIDLDVDIEIDVGRDMTVEDEGAVGQTTVYADPVAAREATIVAQLERLRKAFVKTVDSVAEASGAVILVDEFHHLRGHLIGDWLLRLVTGPERTVVVIATRVALDEHAAETRPLESTELQPFVEDKVREYLEHRLGAASVDASLVQRVLDFSDGLPQAVAMAADLIEQRRRTGGELHLEDVKVHPSTATRNLLSTIVKEVSEQDVKQLLKEGRFARRIDVDVVHYLLWGERYTNGSEDQRKRADDAFEALRTYSFVEPYRGGDDSLGRYAFHGYITHAGPLAGDETLRVDEERAHGRLAAYYERRLDDYDKEESEESSYKQLYKLESAKWQALAREWFHHASRLERDDAREAARLAFIRIFLQTFWWWGYYVRYDFCEELLTDWERTQPERDRAWTASLHQILDSYPTGYDKLDKGAWAKVDAALRALSKTVRVEGKLALDDEGVEDARELKYRSNRRWVRALTSLFRAHSYRFRTGMAKLALPLYDDAIEHLTAEKATAALAWTLFGRAELHLELGGTDSAAASLAEAAKLAAAAAREGEEPEDLELLANLQRLNADIGAKRDDDDLAIDATARAVLRAYAFLDYPEPPDPYTVAFYNEMRERAAERLCDVRRRKGAAAAGQAAKRLFERLEVLCRPFGLVDAAAAAAAALEGGGADPRAALVALLPAPPAALGERARDDPVFTTTAQFVLLDVREDPSDAELRGEA